MLIQESKLGEIKKSATVALRQTPPYRYRSTSYSLTGRAMQSRSVIMSSPPCMETRSRRKYLSYLSMNVLIHPVVVIVSKVNKILELTL